MAVIPYQPTFSVQPKYGFRYMSQPPIPNVNQTQQPPKVGLDGSKSAPPQVMGVQESTTSYINDPFDDNQFGGVRDKRPVAQALGYQQPASNVGSAIGGFLGAMAGVPVIGGALGNAAASMDSSDQPAYGTMGTYDAQGNVFGDAGRAYDPVTGSAVASYASPSAAYNTITGGYDKLRAAGENPLSAALGSYDNSIYNISRFDRMQGITPASQQGLSTTYGLMRSNMDPGPAEAPAIITPEMLGFDPMERDYGVPEGGLTGEIGADIGDVFISGDTYQPYIVSDDGSLVGQSGTLVQTTNPATGESVSLLSPKEDGGYTSAGANEIAATLTPDYYYDDGGDENYSGNSYSVNSSSNNSGWGNSPGGEFGAGRTDDDDWDDFDYDDSPSANDTGSGGGGGYSCYVATALNDAGIWSSYKKLRLLSWCMKTKPANSFLTKLWRNGYCWFGKEVIAPNVNSKAIQWLSDGFYSSRIKNKKDIKSIVGYLFFTIPSYSVGILKLLTGKLVNIRRT